METLATNYLTRAEIWLCATILIYFLMNGAQIFETLVFVPKWASPPYDFRLLTDGKGFSLKNFWIIFHSVHEIVFILAIIFCWKIIPVKNWLLILFAIHIIVRVWTLAFFAPNIIHFQHLPETKEISRELIRKISLWQTLNYVRVAVFIAISFALIPVCIKLFSLRQ